EPLPGNTGGDFGLREPVHETTTDSRTGEDEGVSRQASHGRRHLRHRERNSPVKNRMRETCTSGSVRGGDGDIPTYSAPWEPYAGCDREAGVSLPVQVWSVQSRAGRTGASLAGVAATRGPKRRQRLDGVWN